MKKNRSSLKEFIQSNKLILLIWSILFCSQLLFIGENIGRTLAIQSFMVMWLVLGTHKKNFIISSLLLLLLILPFNITVAFPSLVDPYVRGVFSNYLSPTLSILDLFILFTFFSLNAGRVIKVFKLPKWLYIVILYFLIHSFIQWNLVTLIGSLRAILYVITIYYSTHYFKCLLRKDGLFVALFFTIAAQFFIAVLQFYFGRSIGFDFLGESQVTAGVLGSSFIETSSGVFLRGYGTFPHPNLLAAFMVSAVASLIWIKGFPDKYLKWRLMSFVLASLTIILTFSRIGMLLLVIILLLHFISLYKKTYLPVFYPSVLFERITGIFTGSDHSWNDRISLIKHSWDVIMRNWLVGVGQNNYVSSMKDIYITTSNNLLLLQPVHNIPLLILSEHGIIPGVVILTSLIIHLVRRVIVRKNKYFIASTILILGGFGMGDHFLVTLPQGLFLFFFLLFI